MNKTWSFFDPSTGQFAGRTYSGPEAALEVNTPTGLAPLEGEFDHLSQRVDLDNAEVIDWQPPQPDDDHEWDSERRRWVQTAAARERDVRRMQAQVRIERAEKRQTRAIREHLLGDATALQRLADIEAEIVASRADLR